MSKAKNKREITPLYIQKLKPKDDAFLVWDAKQGGLALSVQPTGMRSWKAIYYAGGRTRWYTIGPLSKVGLAEARKIAKTIMARVALGQDPQREKVDASRAEQPMRFGDLAARYIKAIQSRKSWKQSDYLISKHLLPRWNKRPAIEIARSDVKEMMRGITAPIVANQTLAALSAIYSWAIKEEVGGVKENPAFKIERNAISSRTRVLSDAELGKFWNAFDDAGLMTGTALKVLLLSGQRPGEISHMRYEHVIDGWWEMPGSRVKDGPEPRMRNPIMSGCRNRSAI